jgi:hypothetical protein
MFFKWPNRSKGFLLGALSLSACARRRRAAACFLFYHMACNKKKFTGQMNIRGLLLQTSNQNLDSKPNATTHHHQYYY